MRVNVSSVQDFMQCRFRWWCRWVMNRVPVAESPALDAGKLLHRAFEFHERSGEPLDKCLRDDCDTFRHKIPLQHPAAQPGLLKAVEMMEDLVEAMPLWRDKFKVTEVLEVEQAHEWDDPEVEDLTWLLRPDRVVVVGNRVWHQQRRGLAAGQNFGTYTRLALRHYHEHLYARVLQGQYCSPTRKYGGTIFDLVRKLKFRTNVGKKNEKTKTAEEMFYQQAVAYDLRSGLHRSVMNSLYSHVEEMRRVIRLWEEDDVVPAPNEKLNGGFSGSSEDPYFKVLIGEIELDDEDYFKEREDQYAGTPEE